MNIANEVRRKIQQELDAGATQSELAVKYGLSQGNISRILSGKNTVSFETLETMFPDAIINLDGKSIPQRPMLVDDFNVPDAELTLPNAPRFKSVPVISIAQAAEYEPVEPLIDYLREVSESEQMFFDVKDNYFAVEITGDSMAPDYPNGSIALVAAGEFPERGDIVVAKFSTGQVVIKEYHRKNNVVSLLSRNPNGQNFEWNIKEKPGFIQWMFPVIEIVLKPRQQRRAKAGM